MSNPHIFLEELANTKPSSQAIINDANTDLTWSELNKQVIQLSNYLKMYKKVALILSPGPHFITAFLAACRAGNHVVLINPRWTSHEQSRGTHLIGVDIQLRETDEFSYQEWDMGSAGKIFFCGDYKCISKHSKLCPEPSIIFFSSGTNGISLAVSRTIEQIWSETTNYIRTINFSPGDRIATTTPLCHAYALVNGFLAALATGSAYLPMNGQQTPRSLLRQLANARINIIASVPTLYNAITKVQDPSIETLRKNIRILMSAGAPLSVEVKNRVRKILGVPLYNLYGSTETGTISFERSGIEGGVGKPMLGITVEIQEGGRQLPSGEVGQICVKGTNIASGYLNNVLTELFTNGMFSTRDRGWIDSEGCLHLVGRNDDVINVAGNKVDPVEVEDVLMQLPDIQEVVVVASPSPQGDRVAAIIKAKYPISLAYIQEWARKQLAAYKIPCVIKCVESIPKGVTGKISRSHLAHQIFPQAVTIVVVTYNQLGHTRRCLESLLKTDYPMFQIAVIDNGSNDDTCDYLFAFRKMATEVEVPISLTLLNHNYGASIARNIGSRLTKTPLLVFIDNDTTFPNRDWLFQLVENYYKDSCIGIIGPKLLYPFPPYLIQSAGGGIARNGKVGELGRGQPNNTPEFEKPRDVQFLTSACWLVSRKVFIEASGFSEDYQPYYFEEIDFCYRVKSLGYRLRYEPKAQVHHYENATSTVLNRDFKRIIVRNQAKFKKRWSFVFEQENGPDPSNLKYTFINKPTLELLPTVFPEKRTTE